MSEPVCGAQVTDLLDKLRTCSELPGHDGDHIANGLVYWARDPQAERIAALEAALAAQKPIVEAAAALVEHYEPEKTRDFREYTGELANLLDALAAAVRKGTP